ncbi:MAG: large subunit ribosomal protein L3 [Candidatus Latescibacterota bacterium]|jgi:large subunit ribosomal protein L3
MGALIGKKLGMTQVYNEKDELVPVTVVAAGPCPIVQVRSQDSNGYDALQLAFEEVPARKVNKPESGHLTKAGVGPHRVLREFRSLEGDFKIGQVLDVSQFEVGQQVKVTGRSKGKGFAGVVKKYHFKGLGTTHGTPGRVRHGGSIGQGTTPGKVWKGKKMPGQMGNAIVSTKGLDVVRIDSERNLLFIKGAIPGGVNGFLNIQTS